MIRLLPLWLLATTVLADTCQFTLELTWQNGAPDGYTREMIFVNGQYPGPALEVNQGDWVEVEVVNKMPFNTTVHYHGINQQNTPWSDGVPGLSQRPIQPGASFKYNWHAGQYGSFWYHAHVLGQIDDGLYGPIIIKPQSGSASPFAKIASADVDLLKAAEANVYPVILSDWAHPTSAEALKVEQASGVEIVCKDSLLINGKGSVTCLSRQEIDALTPPSLASVLKPANLSLTNKGCVPPQFFQISLPKDKSFNFGAIPPSYFDVCTPTQGSVEVIQANKDKKWLALDVISTSSIGIFAFSIDEHPMWIYAVDGHYIEPMQVDAIQVANGDRYSVFIALDKTSGNYGIRSASASVVQIIETTAVLAYGKSNSTNVQSMPYIDAGGNPTSSDVVFYNQSLQVSFPPQYPTAEPEIAQTIILSLQSSETSATSWSLNGTQFNSAFVYNLDTPLLYQTPSIQSYDKNTIIMTKNNTWVDIVLFIALPSEPPHPIHKHSSKGFIIGSGTGNFTWATVAEAAKAVPQNFNFVSPPYRDGFLTPPTTTEPAWLVVRYHVVNPGAFLLHCHIQPHLEEGMAMAILDGVDEWPQVPDDCKN